MSTANTAWRYANFSVYPQATHLLVTIREDHTDDPDGKHPENVVYTLCIVDTKNVTVEVLTHGADFYASPVFNPSGNKIAWQEWYLPDLPWQGGIIYVADVVASGGAIGISNHVQVAGQKQTASATFPSWIGDTTLLYTSDKDQDNRFQNPFIFDTVAQTSTPVLDEPLDKDFAEPAWYLGLYPYAILGGGTYGAFTAFDGGRNILYVIGLEGYSKPVQIDNSIFDFAVAQHLRPLGEDAFVFTGSKSTSPGGVFQGTIIQSSGTYTAKFDPLKTTGEHPDWDKYIATPIAKPLQADDHTIYVVYYLPTNPDFVAPSGEKPPCILNVHGGPTGLEPQALNWTKTYYTSRGFAWYVPHRYISVNAYSDAVLTGWTSIIVDPPDMDGTICEDPTQCLCILFTLTSLSELLNGNWGYYDIDDCKEAHTILADEGVLDAKRVAIRGGSAGGYTTLSSLTFAPEPGYYKAACSAYGGVADPTLLLKVTEKLESQYLYTLFGSTDVTTWDVRNPIKNIKNPDTGEVNFRVPLLVSGPLGLCLRCMLIALSFFDVDAAW